MAKIFKFLENKDNVKDISREIAEAFKTKADKTNVEYGFDIAHGTGKIKSKEANTSFCFDTDKGTKLNEMKKLLFDEDLSYIERDSEEEVDLMNRVTLFIKYVCSDINFNYEEDIKEVIRKIVLPTSREEDIPLNVIEILFLDIADYDSVPDSEKYMLKIGKEPDTDIDTDKVVIFLHDRAEETGKTIEEIFQEEKLINPLFEKVTFIERGDKYIYDINVIMFIDYSLSKLPPEEESVREPL